MKETIPQSAQSQVDLLDRILAIGEAIQKEVTTDPKKVYQMIVEGVCDQTGAECAVLYPYHPSFGEFYDIENVASFGLQHKLELPQRANKRIGLTARIHRWGEVINEDVAQAEASVRETPFIVREEIKAFMGMSLGVGDSITGILYVDYRRPHRFSDQEKRVIRLFGQQAAAAVSTSWSHRQTNIRAEAISKLKTIGETLVAIEGAQGIPKTLDRVLQEIAHNAMEVLDADIVDLYQYNEARKEFVLPATLVGQRRQPNIAKTEIYEDDVLLQAVKIGEPQYHPDAQETALLTAAFQVVRNDVPDQRFVVREGVVSAAVIPLEARGEIVGVMFVNYRTPQFFNVEQREVIESFATQAALAIYNARLLQLERTQRQQSERLREVSRIVNSTLEREQVADLVLDQLRQVVGYDSASVQLIQGDRRYLIGSHGVRFDPSHPLLLRNLSQDPLISQIVREKQPLVLPDVSTEPLWDNDIPETSWINSWMGIPLVVRERVVGVLTVDHGRTGHYSAEDGEIAAAFANHVALALRNADLYHKLEWLNQAAIQLNKIYDAEEVYRSIPRAVTEIMDCDYCTVFLLKSDNRLVSHVAGGKLFTERPRLQFAPGEGLAGWVFQQNQSQLVNNTAEDGRYKPASSQQEPKPRSMLLSPLRCGKQVVGVISADLDRIDAFDENDLYLLDTLALHAGTMLENIDYFKDLQVLHEAATELAQQSTLEEVYQTAVESAVQTFHCQHSTIFILDRAAGELVAKARVGAPQPASEVRRFKLGEGLAGKVAQANRPRLVNDTAREDDFIEGQVKPASAPRSIILAPIKIAGEVIGVISADKDEIGGFSEYNLETLETLALDVGIAINVCRQQERLQAIAGFQQAISDILPVQQQLEQIYQKMSGLMDTGSMFIALYDRDTERIHFPLVYRNGKLIDEELKVEGQPYASRRLGVYRGFTEWVLDHKDPLLIENFDTWPHKEEIDPQFSENLKCCLLAPALLQNEIIAVIGLQSFDHPRVFDEADRDLLLTIARQAAIAIENSRLFNQSMRQRNELQLVNEIGQLLMSTLDPREIPRLLLRQVIRLFGVEGASLWRIDGRHLECLFSLDAQGREEPFLDKIRDLSFELGQGVLGVVAETGRAMIVNNPQTEPRWDSRVDEATGFKTQAILAAPLVYRQDTVGVVEILNRVDGAPFTTDDQNFLTSIVSPAAIAFENAQLYQNLKQRVDDLNALNQVGQALTAGIRLKEPQILDLIHTQASKLMSMDDMYIALYDEVTDTVRFGLVMEKGERLAEQALQPGGPYQPRSGGAGRTEEIIRNKQYIFHKTGTEAEHWYAQAGHQEYVGSISSSWIGVPMMVGQKVLGVIAAYDPERDHVYDDYDLQVLQTLASQAAIALDNARLYYEVNQALEQTNLNLERRVDALSNLSEVGQTLTAGLRLQEDEIIQLIYEQTRKLTNTQDLYIALYDEQTEEIRFSLALEAGDEVVYPARKADMNRRGRTEEIILTREPILVKTLPESEEWYDHPEREEFLGRVQPSFLGVPMIVSDKVLGVIAAQDWGQEYAYDELDLQVLNSMADQAAIALDNSRLYYEINQALERRVEALDSLNDVGKRLVARLQEDQILELIYDEVRELTDTENIYLALYDEKSSMVTFKWLLEKGRRVEIEQVPGFAPRQIDRSQLGKTEAVILQRQSILHQTRAEEEAWYQKPDHRQYFDRLAASHLAVPMLLGQRAIGVIAVYDWEKEYAYDKQDEEVLTTMASQAAIALENARLFGERQRRLEALQQITARMVEASLDPDEVLEMVARAANDFSQCELTSIYLFDQESATFTRGVQVRRNGRVEQVEPDQLPLTEDLPLKIAQTRQSEFVTDVSINPEAYTFASRHQLQAFAGLPLVTAGAPVGQTTVGVLFVNFKESHPFSDDEQEILHHLANQAAVAIAYASAQESAQAREQLAALGTAAASLQHRLGNTINVILPAVMRLRYRVGEDETNIQILDTIERNALFATEVIRRMQTPLRPETFVRTNINSLIRDAVQKCLQEKERFSQVFLNTTLPEIIKEAPTDLEEARPEIMVVAELDDQVPETFVRSGQITEVFRVLVENGIKAIHPQAGTVVVKSYVTSDAHRPCVEVTVSDTGKGIDEKTSSRLFKQPVPRKVFGEGAGLGLWLSHFIVRSHQGNLRLQETELDKGSTFLVRLPILDQPPPAENIQKEERNGR